MEPQGSHAKVGSIAPQQSTSQVSAMAAKAIQSLLQISDWEGIGRRLVLKTWPNFWWWFVVVLSVPFIPYALVYVLALEPAIREMSIAKSDGLPDDGTYSQGILDHMKLWQAHASCAVVYCVSAPLQFADDVRLRHAPLHRTSGYAFLASGCIRAGTGLLMAPHSEFGHAFVLTSSFLAPTWLFSAANAVWSVRKRRFQPHREWMIRTAAIGFSVMPVRLLIPILAATFGISYREAGGPAQWICFALALAGTQLYIEMRYHGYGGLVPRAKLKPAE